MRQLIGILAICSLANLLFMPGNSACPMAGGAPESSRVAGAPDHAGHDSHHAGPLSTGGDAAQSFPDDHSGDPQCLTMGPCAVTLDVVRAAAIDAGTQAIGVVALNAFYPPTPSAAPDIPPPRA